MKKLISILLIAVIAVSLFSFSSSAATSTEAESNNSYSAADSISVGNSITGSLSSYQDEDYFKITAPSNGKLSLTFKHTYQNSNNLWIVRVYFYSNGAYNELSSNTVRLTDNESVNLPFVGTVSNGVYYVKISGAGYSEPVGTKYTITTSFTSSDNYEKELNNSYSSASVLGSNSSIKGVINGYGDSDFYKITTSSNGKLSLTFKHTYQNSNNIWAVSVYYYSNGAYNELSSNTIRLTDSESVNLPFVGAVSNGVYYVKIANVGYSEPVGREYTVSSSFSSANNYEKELNNSYQTATNINIGTIYSGSISAYGDSDFFKFVPSSSGTISVKFMHTHQNSSKIWAITVYQYSNGAYNNLSSTTVNLSDNSEVSLPSVGASANSTYYIKVATVGYSEPIGIEYSILVGSSSSSSSATTYTLSYNANGGSGAPSAQTGNTTYTISYTEPSRSGYKFLGWSTSSNATYASYEGGDSVRLTGNATLYAVWEKIESETPGSDNSPTPDTPSFDFSIILDILMYIPNLIIEIFNLILDLF